MSDLDVFEVERARLIGIAYRLLGTPDDADDVVQETWLRYSANEEALRNPAAWLTTVVTRLALDKLRSAQLRREHYVGPWMSEPWFDVPAPNADPGDQLVMYESISLGFMAVVERLSPLERAVFVLHKVFDLPLAEVATVIERTPAATRQLSKRASDHIDEGRPRFDTNQAEVEALTEMVLSAAMSGDLDALESYLAPDVVHISDGGKDHRAARLPVVGRDRVARLIVGIVKRMEPDMEFHSVLANGQLGLYTTKGGEPYMLHVSNVVDGLITGSFAVRNPDKLAAFHRAWSAANIIP